MDSLPVHIAILTIADDAASADRATAQAVSERATAAGHEVVDEEIVKDNESAIRDQLVRWIAEPNIDVVIVAASVESEAASAALAPLIMQTLPGFTDLFRWLTFQEIGASAMLSAAEAAQCESTFVFVLPAHAAAVRAAMDKLILPQLDVRTKPKNLVTQMPRLKDAAKELARLQPAAAPTAEAVPVPIAAEKTAGGSGLPPKLPARSKPPTANLIARKQEDPPTKEIDLGKLEKQIRLSNQHDAHTKEIDLNAHQATTRVVDMSAHQAKTRVVDSGKLPRIPPGADERAGDDDTDALTFRPPSRTASPSSQGLPSITRSSAPIGVVKSSTPAFSTPIARSGRDSRPPMTTPAAAWKPNPPAEPRRPAPTPLAPLPIVQSRKPAITPTGLKPVAATPTAGTPAATPIAQPRTRPPTDTPRPQPQRTEPPKPEPSPVAVATPAIDESLASDSIEELDASELSPADSLEQLPAAQPHKPPPPPSPAPAPEAPASPSAAAEDAPPSPAVAAAEATPSRPRTIPPPEPDRLAELTGRPLPQLDTSQADFAYPIKRSGSRLLLKVVLGLAVLGLGFFAFIRFYPQDDQPTQTAAVTPDPGSAAKPPEPPKTEEPATPAAEPPAPAPAPEPAAKPTDPAPAPAETPAPAPAPAPPPTPASTSHSHATASHAAATKPATKPDTKPATGEPAATAPATKPAEPAAKPAEPAAGGDCDEVSCVMTKYDRPCCEKYRPTDGFTPRNVVPDNLEKSMIKTGVEKIKAKVVACGEKNGAKGTVKLAVSVEPEGNVKNVSVSESPDQALGECVAGAMRKAKFGRSANGGEFIYPFVF